jgi:hypothetical protein
LHHHLQAVTKEEEEVGEEARLAVEELWGSGRGGAEGERVASEEEAPCAGGAQEELATAERS